MFQMLLHVICMCKGKKKKNRTYTNKAIHLFCAFGIRFAGQRQEKHVRLCGPFVFHNAWPGTGLSNS